MNRRMDIKHNNRPDSYSKKIRQSSLCTACTIALLSANASALPMTFSVEVQGPTAGTGVPDSFTGLPIRGTDILTPFPPGPPGPNPPAHGPLPPPGIFIPAQPFVAPSPFLGPTNGWGELDALSYGRDVLVNPGNPNFQYYFSVDEFAVGNPFPTITGGLPDVSTEGATGNMEASTDVFRSQIPSGLGGFLPPGASMGVGFGNTDVLDGDGLPPFSGPGTGLIEPNPPTPVAGGAPGQIDPGDNLDALDTDTGPLASISAVYGSLDSAFADPLETFAPPPNYGTATANGFVGGDVLIGAAGGVRIYAPAFLLGLDVFGPDTDDLDALILTESGDGFFTPSSLLFDWLAGTTDMLLFSVRRGSAVIGMPDSIWGAPIEEGDILTTPLLGGFSPFPGIFIPAEALGLATVRTGTAASYGVFNPAYGLDVWADDLDALDAIPEPTTLALIGLGLAGIGYQRRRKLFAS